MLFDRFIFVLYVLFTYSWFLLGESYKSPLRFVPIVSMICSLFAVMIVSMFQLQTYFSRMRHVSSADRWSTIMWSGVHVLMAVHFVLDGVEVVNTLVIFGLIGLLLTAIIVSVSVCSCYVIIRNSSSWCAHIHLTCICVWVAVQYMAIRIPEVPIGFMTTLPVVCMGCVRVFEWVESNSFDWKESLMWVICIVLHALRDLEWIPTLTLQWGMVITVMLMVVTSQHILSLFILVAAPFMVFPVMIYVLGVRCTGEHLRVSLTRIIKTYEEFVFEEAPLKVEPLGTEVDDWTPL